MTAPTLAPKTLDTLREIARHDLHPSPFNPPERWEQPDPELAASMKLQGVIEPLIVRLRAKGGYEIVAGHRRWAAAVLTGLSALPCIVRQMADSQVAAAQLAENDQREGFSPLARAKLYAQDMKAFGWTQEQLATVVSRTPAHVSQVLSLLELPKPAVKLVEQGKLDFTSARELVKLKAFPKRLEAVLEGVEYGDYRTSKHVAREVKYQLEDEAAANKRVQEAEDAKKKASEARQKTKADKKAIAAAKRERALERKRREQEQADAARAQAIAAEVKKVIVERAPAFALSVVVIRKKLSLPERFAAVLAERYEPGEVWNRKQTRHLHQLVEAIAPRLPGEWTKVVPLYGGAHSAKNAAAKLSWLALGAWLDLETDGLDAELEAAAKGRVAAATKAAAVNASKPPARTGGRK